jgi:hypothetical protein
MHDRPKAAYNYARLAMEIPRPHEDTLFIEEIPYSWGILDELGAVAHSVGKFHLGMQVCHKLLCEKKFPPEHEARIKNNFESYKNIVAQIQQQRGVTEMMEKQKQKELKKINKKKKHKV